MATSFSLIRRALQIRRGRFLLAVGGIALSVLLVLSLAASLRSASGVFSVYIARPGADLWVAPRGTDNLVRSSSIMPISYRKQLLSVPGVKKADPVLKSFVSVKPRLGAEATDKHLTLLGIVYEAPDGLGGPPLFAEGRPPERQGEVALDRAAAMKLGVHVRDRVLVDGRSKTVTGLTAGTNLIVTHFVFSSYRDLDPAGPYRGLASFFIVSVADKAHLQDTAGRVRKRLGAVDVFDQTEFLENNRKELAAGYITILTLVYVIGVAAAAVLVALIIHGIVEEKRREMAVLLALGVSEVWLWGALGWAGAFLAFVGSVIGTLVTLVLSAALDAFFPVLPLSFVPRDAANIVALLTVSGLAAALAPVMKLRAIDPLEAFHP